MNKGEFAEELLDKVRLLVTRLHERARMSVEDLAKKVSGDDCDDLPAVLNERSGFFAGRFLTVYDAERYG